MKFNVDIRYEEKKKNTIVAYNQHILEGQGD